MSVDSIGARVSRILETLPPDITLVAAAKSRTPEEDTSSRETTDLEYVAPDDLLSVYLAEISRKPLLSRDEEIELARRIEVGRQALKTLLETDYTAKERARLQAQVDAGQAARRCFARANTRLVVNIAKWYRGYGLPFIDLIQEGNVGLMRAVDRYDPDRGNRFSTYAIWWIRHAVTRALTKNGRVIRIPVHTSGRMRKMARIAQRLEIAQGRRPSPEEIAADMGESPARVRQMMRWTIRPLSLEQPVGEMGQAELGDFVQDEKTCEPEEFTDIHLLDEALKELLSELTAREAYILRLRYGLQDGQTRTLQEVAEKFSLSRERIRQIERKALAKLRLAAPRFHLEECWVED